MLQQIQMATEKLAKAYLWRNTAPPRTHACFVNFLRFLGHVRRSLDQQRMADSFDFKNYDSLRSALASMLPIAYELERITPDLAQDGPNVEYPWPHAAPLVAPVGFQFPVWQHLQTSTGRRLMRLVQAGIRRFPEYADI